MRAPVLLTLLLAAPLWAQPIFTLNPSTLTVTFAAGAGGDQIRNVTFILQNEGDAANFLVRTDQPWIEVVTQSGFVGSKQSVTLSVTVVANGFEAGQYQALVTITSGNVSTTLTIVLSVTGIRIAASPNLLEFFNSAGGGFQSKPVVVTGANGASGSITVQKDSGGVWLTSTTTPSSGALPATVMVGTNATTLGPGNYTGKLRVSCFAPTQCSPQIINVNLQVFGSAKLSINPTSVAYSTPASAPTLQSSKVTLLNTGDDSAFTTTVSNLPGVSVFPPNGTIRRGQPLDITVTANPAGVVPGRYSGNVKFAGSGLSSSDATATLSVSFAVLGIDVSTSVLTLSALKGKLSSADLAVLGTEAFTVQRQTGGPWLTFAPASGTAPQTITVTGDAATLAEGLSQGALAVSCASNCVTKAVNIQFNVVPSRVVSSADYKAGLAPGSIVAAFLPGKPGITTATQSGSLPLPTTIAGVSVTVQDGASRQLPARLFFVSPEQVNFEVPEAATLGPATVTLRNLSGVYASGNFSISAIAPSLYSQDGSGTGPPAGYARYFSANGGETTVLVANCDAANKCTPVAINVRQAPTVFLELYGTGIRNRSDLSRVSINIGGTILPVVYAGPQPQFPGLDQVDVQLPASLGGRGAVTLVLTVDGVASQPVNLVFQ